jgi:hypothetical protein
VNNAVLSFGGGNLQQQIVQVDVLTNSLTPTPVNGVPITFDSPPPWVQIAVNQPYTPPNSPVSTTLLTISVDPMHPSDQAEIFIHSSTAEVNGGVVVARPMPGSMSLPGSTDHFYIATDPATALLQTRPQQESLSCKTNGPSTSQNVSVFAADNVSSIPFNYSVSYLQGQQWLQVDQLGNTTLSVLALTANCAGLAPGTYQALVTLLVNGSTTDAQIPVTLTVTAPDIAPVLMLSSTNLNFDYDKTRRTSVSGLSSKVHVSGNVAIQFTTSVQVLQGAGWLTVDKAGATTDTDLTITADASFLAASPIPYRGTVFVNYTGGQAIVNVAFTVSSTAAQVTQVFPLYIDDVLLGIQNLFTVFNTDVGASNYTIALNPAIDWSPLTGALGPHAFSSIATSGQNISTGWSQAAFDPKVRVFQWMQMAGLQEETAIPPMTSGLTDFLVPFDNLQDDTWLMVSNAGSVNSSCNVSAWTEGGATRQLGGIVVGAQAAIFTDLNQTPPIAGLRGVMELVCNQPLFPLAHRWGSYFGPAAHEAFSRGGALGSTTSVLGTALDGPAYRTNIVLTNTGTQSQAYSLRVWQTRSAGPVSGMIPDSQLTGTVPASGEVTLATQGNGSATSPLAQQAGPLPWVELTAAGTVKAVLVYQQGLDLSSPGGETAIVSGKATGRSFVFPFDNTQGYSTAAAIVNATAQQANLSLHGHNADGTDLGIQPLAIGPGQSGFVQFNGSSSFALRRGYVELMSDNDVTVTLIRSTPTGAFSVFAPAAP